jgi:hypothetical protein
MSADWDLADKYHAVREALERSAEGLDHAAAALRDVGSNPNAKVAEQDAHRARVVLGNGPPRVVLGKGP